MAIGEPFSNFNKGVVNIYYWKGDTWVSRGSIEGDRTFREHGTSVSLSSD